MHTTGWIGAATLLVAGSLAGAQPTAAELDRMYQAAQKTRLAGKFREALAQLDKSLKIHEKALGTGAVEIGHHHYNYAYCFSNLKEWRKCAEACVRAKAIYRVRLKQDDEGILWMHDLHGRACHELGDYEKAIEEYGRAIRFPERNKEGKGAERCVECCANAANCYWSLGQFAKAEDWGDRALRHAEKRLGPKHLTLAWARRRISHVKYGLGDPVRAKALLAGALEILDTPARPNRAELGYALNALSGIHAEDDPEEADRLSRRAVEELDRHFGAESASHLDALNSAAARSMEKGDLAQAEAYARQALKNCAAKKENGYETAIASLRLGQVCLRRGKHKEAEELLLAAQKYFSEQTDFIRCKY